MEKIHFADSSSGTVNKENIGSSSSNNSQESGQSDPNTAGQSNQQDIPSDYEDIRPIMSGPAPKQDIHREPYLLGEAAKSGLCSLLPKN